MINIKKMFKKLIKKINMELFLLIIIIIVVSLSYGIYKEHVKKIVNKNTTDLLHEIINESIDDISIKIEDNFVKLEAMSDFIGQYDDIQNESVLRALKMQSDDELMRYSGVIRLDGLGVTANGDTFQADFEDWYFEEALTGKRSISEVLTSDEYSGEYLLLAVPIFQDGSVAGVLQCAYDIEEFTGIIGDTTIGKKGTTFIAQNDGTLVSRPVSVGNYTNLFDLLNKFSDDEAVVRNLKNKILNRDSAIITLNSGKFKRYVCFSTIPSTNWYAVSVVTSTAVNDGTDDIIDAALMLSTGVTVVFSIFILYWFIVHYLNVRAMRMKEQRYHIVANQSDSIVFECKWSDKSAYHTHKWEEKFGYPPVTENYIENMTDKNIVFKDDVDKFKTIFSKLEGNESDYEENYIRINNSDGIPVECKIRASAIRNKRGKIVRIVGKILEIKKYNGN